MTNHEEILPSDGLSEVPDHLYEGYIFDLDGTIYLGDELLPGAEWLILKLRELGKKVVFLSNNPTRDPEMYAEIWCQASHAVDDNCNCRVFPPRMAQRRTRSAAESHLEGERIMRESCS